MSPSSNWQRLLALDLRLARGFSEGFRLPESIEKTLRLYTRLGDGYIWVLLVALLFIAYPLDQAAAIIREACMTAVLSILTYKYVKAATKRKRPYAQSSAGEARIDPLDEFSFPSGHTMNNLAVGLAMAYYNPWIGGSLAAIALSWGVLRVHFGVHFFTDVLAGALFALGCSWLGHQLNLTLLQVLPPP